MAAETRTVARADKSGVYTHKTGAALGGHAVSFIGWGTMDGTDYWLVKNSWNDAWGDGGTFKVSHASTISLVCSSSHTNCRSLLTKKIKRGTNECGIEDEVAGINF